LGVFGGTVEPEESVEAALLRELREELGFAPKNLHYFLDTIFNFGFLAGPLARSTFEIELTGAAAGKLKLLESQLMRIFSPASLQSDLPIVPCDRFVLDLHISRREKQMALRDLT
jgi:8-oxo-dGTP pyrophosphatase MutT (NUDIX family)